MPWLVQLGPGCASTVRVKMAWLRLETLFIAVAAVTLPSLDFSRRDIVVSRLVTCRNSGVRANTKQVRQGKNRLTLLD